MDTPKIKINQRLYWMFTKYAPDWEQHQQQPLVTPESEKPDDAEIQERQDIIATRIMDYQRLWSYKEGDNF